ncbi:response regulator [Clostridium sp. MCC353]|uniref:response regulator transcription factor n=1 Tax=Clostridium sp. MCC353 TaxID=2592646 RepID=UPI001C027F67|nr:response regulator transcription factor [Clostridium sp. MCC353]MBT9777420.1 response regulator [Clostridium sp. MCC353]
MIYLVEDDNSIRELVIYTLQSTGFQAAGFSCGKEFWEGMRKEVPSLILLDIMLPDEDGLTILKKIRNASDTSRIPVIMLTAKGTEYDKVIGLDSGADDYIPKPFGMMELVSRVKAVLRRTEPEQKTRLYELGPIKVDVIRHTVHVSGEAVNLTYKEFELLCYLMENEGIVLSRDQLLSKIWGYDFDGETRTVDVHIRTLRQKLGTGGNYIETIRGVGYKIEEI